MATSAQMWLAVRTEPLWLVDGLQKGYLRAKYLLVKSVPNPLSLFHNFLNVVGVYSLTNNCPRFVEKIA